MKKLISPGIFKKTNNAKKNTANGGKKKKDFSNTEETCGRCCFSDTLRSSRLPCRINTYRGGRRSSGSIYWRKTRRADWWRHCGRDLVVVVVGGGRGEMQNKQCKRRSCCKTSIPAFFPCKETITKSIACGVTWPAGELCRDTRWRRRRRVSTGAKTRKKIMRMEEK